MRDGTRNENATRLWGAIDMDVNEDNVAPWKVGVDADFDVDVDVDGVEDSDFGCASGCGRGGTEAVTLGMNEVTTATGCAVSRRSERIFWESPRALMLPAARSKEDQRFAAASLSARTAIMVRPGVPLRSKSQVDVCTCLLGPCQTTLMHGVLKRPWSRLALVCIPTGYQMLCCRTIAVLGCHHRITLDRRCRAALCMAQRLALQNITENLFLYYDIIQMCPKQRKYCD